MKPPTASKKDTTLTIHNHNRIDPYFWMRLTDAQKKAKNPDAQTQEVLNYLQSENSYTESKLAHTEALQKKIYDEIVGRIKKDDNTVPYFKNGYWYYVRYQKGLEYPIYCRKEKTLDNKEEILLDVNKMAEGHEYYSVSGLDVSPDNEILAFGEDVLSRRIYTIKFKNLKNGVIYSDSILNTTGGGAWANDNKTYFYTTKNKTTLLSEKISRHKLGTSVDMDKVVYTEKDPSFYIGVSKTKSEKYIIIGCASTLSNDYYLLDADYPDRAFAPFTPREKELEYSIEHYKDKFYVLTNWSAENFRLMETPVHQTEKVHWKEVIPHDKSVLLEDIDVFDKFLVISQRSEGLTQIKVIDQEKGETYFVEPEDPAYVIYPVQNFEFNTSKLRYSYQSMTTPQSVYDMDMRTRKKVLKKRVEVVGGHTPTDYISERIFVTARDGMKIPVSLVYKKTVQKSVNTPLLLYGYGSYGSSMEPWFSISRLSLLDRGFIYAIAHIRGGEEMGRDWYLNGKMFHKKNTFYDFIDCAKYFISQQYTSPSHLYAAGGSAGGLLIGAVANIEPELFHGLIAAVPFVDVVSTMLDETIPLTTNEFDEWGNPKNRDSYEYMLSYSPYDNVERKNYPNMLVTTGLFDSQVQYWEPAKWVAKLRDLKTGDNLLLLHTDMSAGHGGKSGRFKRHKETALEYAFLLDLDKSIN